jgi:hypothetical protein
MSHRGPTVFAIIGFLAAALGLSACGGSSPPSNPASSHAESALEFSKCMRENGVKSFPDPEITPGGGTKLSFNGEGVSRQTLEAAQTACQHFQEEGGQGPELSPQEKVEREEELQKFAKCMREHGIEVVTKVSPGGGVAVGIKGGAGAGKNPESPAVAAAQKACQGLLPGPRGGTQSSAAGPAKGG